MANDVSRSTEVRPPKWETGRASSSSSKLPVAELRRLQVEYLGIFREKCTSKKWSELQRMHFDWWQFPIDDGSRLEFNLKSESDIDLLKSDCVWLSNYLESIKLLALSWGWDVDKKTQSLIGGKWNKNDVRLAKIIRSLWLFQINEYFESMQMFAHHINDQEYNERGFFYGSICLDEILIMGLPR